MFHLDIAHNAWVFGELASGTDLLLANAPGCDEINVKVVRSNSYWASAQSIFERYPDYR